MSGPAWRRWLRLPAPPPESFASTGRHSDTRRPGSSSDSFDSSPARAAAGARATARNLWRGLLSALLCLPLFFGLAAGVQAQTAILSISAPADANEGDSGTRNLAFTVSLSRAVTNATNFRVCFTGTATIDTTAAGTIPAAADYQPGIFMGRTSGSFLAYLANCVDHAVSSNATRPRNPITIRVKGDTEAEGDETVIATLSFVGSAPSGVTLGTSVVTHTILDDDSPPTVSISAPEAADEGDSGTTDKHFTLSLSKAVSQDITVQTCYSGTATLGASVDYQRLVVNTVTNSRCLNSNISVGDTSANASIRIRGDTTAEPHETVIATVSLVNPPANVVLGTATATYTIRDDDSTLTPGTPPMPAGFTATAGDSEVTLSWNDPNRSAITSWQYRQRAGAGSYGGWMAISGAGPTTTSHTVTGLINGTTYTFQVQSWARNGAGSMASPVSSEQSATPAASVTLSITAPTDANEGDSDTRNLAFTVGLSRAVTNATNFRVCFTGTATIDTTAAGTIPAAADYQPGISLGGISGSFLKYIASCVDHAVSSNSTRPRNPITIRVKGDTEAESDETVIATLSLRDSNPGVTLGVSVATHTILDDDTSTDGMTLSESSLTLTELHATNAEKTYTVVLNTDPGADVTVTVTSNDATAVTVDTNSVTAGDQSTLTFTHGNSGNWNAAQTVTLRALNDADAAAENVTISHAAAVADSTNPYHQTPIGDVTATTVDAGHGVTVSRASLSVAENSDTGTYAIVLKSQPGGSVTITPTSNAPANATVSGPLTFTTGNWPTAQTITVTGAGAGSATISHMVTTAATGYPTSTTIDSVGVTVTNVAPTVDNPIPNQTATAGTAFSYTFPANTFDDATSLTYTAVKSDNGALPTWLTFTPGTRAFSGTPQSTDVGTLSVKVTADDSNGGSVSDTFNIVVSAAANNAPTVDNLIPNQTATAGTAFSYAFPANTFADADGDSLTYTATKSDNSTLPTWLTFTPGTRAFSGTPQSTDVGTLSVKVTADDGHTGGTVSDTFDIAVGSSLVSISAPTDANEGNSGTTNKLFSVTLSSAHTEGVSVRVCYSGTATRGVSADYQSRFSTAISTNSCATRLIATGSTGTNAYGIQIRGDTDAEPDETVIATLSLVNPPAGVVLGTSTATYTILDDDDTTAPGVTSIERQSPTDEYTNADSLTWRVTFDEAVRNVDAMDFSNTPSEFSGTTELAVSSVSTSVYDITVSDSAIENSNTAIQLAFVNGHDIEDLSGNALPASPTVSGTNSDFFTLDNNAPTVTSIDRHSPTTAMTDADSLTWRVTFGDNGGMIENLDAADFQITGTTASLAVTEDSTDVYDVTASGGDLANLNGTVTLSFANNHDITDDAGNALTDTTPTSGTNDNTFDVQNVVIDPGAPKLVSIKRHAQEVRNLGTSLVWRVSFDKHLPGVYASDFTLTGTTAGLDVRHDLSNYDPKTYKTSVFVYAQGGDLETVNGVVTLSIASNHNIVDFEGRRLASTTPTGANQHTLTLNSNQTLVYYSQPDYYVNEGEDAVVTLKLSRLQETDTLIRFSATPLTATGNGVDYHGSTFRVTIPAWRSSATVNVRTTTKGGREAEETFRLDLHNSILPNGFVSGNAPGSPTTHTYIHILDKETADYHANREPGLVFDNTHLTWNEDAGCDNNTGPSYNVKLKTKPLGPVEVFIKDPDDGNRIHEDGRRSNEFVANNRLYVANSPGYPTRTVLRFTPGNWDKYQLVNVKVRCADHYTAQIPIKHRISAGYIDKYTPSPVYPGYFGIIDKGWTVHVKVRESDPPIVIEGLPAAGQSINVEGSHLDFQITLSEAAFKHSHSIPVYLSARGGKAAGVKRRDGRAQSCGGPLDDCLYFTPSNRTKWVRLFAIGPGRDELKVEIPQLRWGDLEHVRDWEMRWPVEVIATGQGAPAQSAAAPTQAVSNLQVTATDALSASVTWSAVEHARFYEVSWEAQSSDAQTVITGIESVTGTSATIEHNAQEDMTLTVTVTPEYVDGNGITQRMDALAATASLDIGPSAQSLGGGTNDGDGGQVSAGEGDSQASALAACVSAALLTDVQEYAGETWRTSPDHVERWSRVLAAFGVNNAYSSNPMTVAEAQAQADRGLQRWVPVAPALQCLENPPQEEEEKPVTPATPELSLSAGSAVDEGDNATFTITADPAPQSDLTIAWTVAQNGEYLDTPGAGSRTVVLTAGATSTDLPVATVDDDANEADGSISVTLNTGTDYTVATGSAAVTVHDNDAPVVSITAGSGVTEGTSASFTVSASPVPATPLDVALTIGQSGDVAASSETGSKTLTVPVSGSVTFEVATVDDAVEEPNGTLTATISAGTGYTVAAAPDNAATVAVSDNDAASSGPTISIADATMKENQRMGYFTVTLSEPVDRLVSVRYATRDSTPVSARADKDYFAWKRLWKAEIWIGAGKTTGRVPVYLYNDSHDEDPETFEVVLFDASDGVSIADGVAVGTIVNSDPMPAAWLARFGRATAEQALDGIAGRIAASRTAGMRGTIAGQAINFDSGPGSGEDPDGSAANGNTAPGSLADNDLFAQSNVVRAFDAGRGGIGHDAHGFDPDRFADGDAQSWSMTTREVLLGSSFTATGEKDAMGGSLAFWGRAAQSSFDGQEGTFSLDGETTTTMLGADYARDNWLVGMALMQGSGKGKYADTDVMPRPASQTCPEEVEKVNNALCSGTVRDGDGKIEASMTAAVPYASIQASERLKLWGALGYGTGEVTLKPDAGTDEKKESYKSDISWNMMAVGGRQELLSSPQNGPTLDLTGDALWARTESDRTNALAASDSDVTRLRLGLEGSWRIATEGDGSITPKLELGVRQDGGDAETGSGMELGAGIAWSDPGAGLSLDLSGRTLITHTEEDLENEGFSVSFHYDPKPASARGLELSLSQEIGGPSTGGLDALFASEPLSERPDSDEDSRLKLEAAYGFPAFSGQYISTPGVSLVRGSASRDYSLGWHFTPAKSTIGISFGIKATRRESEGADPEHAVGVEATLRW